jgi:hypothetical protein
MLVERSTSWTRQKKPYFPLLLGRSNLSSSLIKGITLCKVKYFATPSNTRRGLAVYLPVEQAKSSRKQRRVDSGPTAKEREKGELTL